MEEDRDRTIDQLEQNLFDERRERDLAQRRSAELFDRVEIWRKRAEDRAVRIKKLEAERDRLRGVAGWLRRGRRLASPPPAAPAPGPTPEPIATTTRRESPMLPGVRCVTAISSPDLAEATALLDSCPLDQSVSLMEADVVLVDAAGFASLDRDTSVLLVEWAAVAGRPPLIVVEGTPTEIAQYAQREIGRHDLTGRFFDPSKWNPSTRLESDAELGDIASAFVTGFGSVAVDPFDARSTRHLELAAQGVPFAGPNSSALSADDARRLSVQYRRFAFERRIAEAERFCEQLMLDTPNLRPAVAGILVTNRPDDAARAIEQLADQKAPRFEVVVGCHGFSSAVVAGQLDLLATNVPVTVLEFGAAESLGACLNQAVASTGASVLAKMDDDDHYGPGYLVDALHALSYGGAPIVGKGTSFTYLESEDKTVVRRPGNEERLSNGSPTGATLVWARSVWEANPFVHRTLGEDLAFLRGVRRLGHQVYINSAYEFVYHRRRTGNTWQAADQLFLEGAVAAWDGDDPVRADVPDLVVSSA